MIRAKHNKYITFFFRHYINLILKRHFHIITITGDIPEPDRAILMIGNHFSWWDGFFAFYVNFTMLHKRFHVMMLEEQLAKRKFFRGLGAFSVQPYSRSIIESLHYASGLLQDPENMLVFYPQGRIETSYIQHIRFSKGVMKIWDDIEGTKPSILFYVALVDYFSNPKPTLNIYLSPLVIPPKLTLHYLEQHYNDFYLACITLQQELWKQPQ